MDSTRINITDVNIARNETNYTINLNMYVHKSILQPNPIYIIQINDIEINNLAEIEINSIISKIWINFF